MSKEKDFQQKTRHPKDQPQSKSAWDEIIQEYKYEGKLKRKVAIKKVEDSDVLYYADKTVFVSKGEPLTIVDVRSITKTNISVSLLKATGIVASDFDKDGKIVVLSDGSSRRMRKNKEIIALFVDIKEEDKDKFLFNENALKFVNKEEYEKARNKRDDEDDEKERADGKKPSEDKLKERADGKKPSEDKLKERADGKKPSEDKAKEKVDGKEPKDEKPKGDKEGEDKKEEKAEKKVEIEGEEPEKKKKDEEEGDNPTASEE